MFIKKIVLYIYHEKYLKDNHVIKSKLETITEGRNIDENNENENAVQMDQYCEFRNDYTFYYWDYYKDLNIADMDNNIGYNYNDWYIEQKYDNLKDEVLNNKIYQIDRYDYQEILYKATKLSQLSQCIKSMVYIEDIGDDDTNHYGINDGEIISVYHIFCILLYCDYSIFSYHFRNTFRKLNASETHKQLKERNCEFWFISKYLRECVQCFGSIIGGYKTNKYYTSISHNTLFTKFDARFVGITSMTSQLSVITNYCINDIYNKNGIILEFDILNTSDQTLKFLDCNIFSRFPNEDEKIFFGSKSKLKFGSIKIIENNKDYKCFIKAIEIFIDAMNGRKYERSDDGNDDELIERKDYKIINKLCEYQLDKTKNNSFPHYINQMFMNLCHLKYEVHIDLYNLNKYYYGLNEKFIHSECNNLILFDYICLLFPNCRYIKIDEVGRVKMEFFNELLQIIDNINHNKKLNKKNKCDSKIRKIEIRTIEIDYNEYKLNNIESIFANKNWFIDVEQHSFSNQDDNNMIITDLVLTKQKYNNNNIKYTSFNAAKYPISI